jgi:hypothetical protein
MNAIYCTKHKRSKPCVICQMNHTEPVPKTEIYRCGICGCRRKKSEEYCNRCKQILER